jgi:hypothetical protein
VRSPEPPPVVWLVLASEWNPHIGSKQIDAQNLYQWIYLGEDSIWRIGAERGLLADLRRISITRQLDQVSQQLRNPYIEWIGALSGYNDSAEWWTSELAAKNPYTNLFIRLCFLRIGKELIESKPLKRTLIVCSSSALLRELSCVAADVNVAVKLFRPSFFKKSYVELRRWSRRNAGAVFRRCLDRSIFWILRVAREKIPQNLLGRSNWNIACRREWIRHKRGGIDPFFGNRTALLFTWIDHRNFPPEGGFADPHLGTLTEELKALGFEVRYVVSMLPDASFVDAAEKLLKMCLPVYFPDYFADPAVIRRCRRRARSFNPVIPKDSEVGGIPVEMLAREHVDDYRVFHAQVLLYEELVYGLSANGVSPEWIIHTCEGHSWEQALAWATRKQMPGTKIAGFENGTFSRMVHSMYPAMSEFTRRPLPDRVLTYGEIARDIFTSEGWPAETIVETGAIRHGHVGVSDTGILAYIGKKRPVQILLAPGIGANETVELVEKAVLAFAGAPEYLLTVKCHPSVDMKSVEAGVGEIIGAREIEWSRAPLDELFRQSHVILFTYTSACFEAIPYGLLPIYVKSENGLNLNKMDTLPSHHWQATEAEDLRNIVEDLLLMSRSDYVEWHSNAMDVIKKVFTPVSTESINAAFA